MCLRMNDRLSSSEEGTIQVPTGLPIDKQARAQHQSSKGNDGERSQYIIESLDESSNVGQK